MSSSLPINLSNLLHGRGVESVRVEFEAAWSPETTGPQVLKTICAFANDHHNLERRLRRHWRCRARRTCRAAAAGSYPRRVGGGAAVAAPQLQPPRSAVPAAALARGGERPAGPGGVGAGEPGPAASGAGRYPRTAALLGARRSRYRGRGTARRAAPGADPADCAGAVGRPPGAGRRPRGPARDGGPGAPARDRQRTHRRTRRGGNLPPHGHHHAGERP